MPSRSVQVVLWCSLAALAGACERSAATDGRATGVSVEPSGNPYPDSPPNAPPPPAMCGDMNGGGDQHVDFPALMAAKIAEKPTALARQADLLALRYDLSDYPLDGVTMTRGKPVQQGARTRLSDGLTWETLAAMTPEAIRQANVFPAGFFPLPHPKQPEQGFLSGRQRLRDQFAHREECNANDQGRATLVDHLSKLPPDHIRPIREVVPY